MHFGSLVAAAASYLDALAAQGRWLLRIEDIDPPREMRGAAARIVRTLDVHGFEWSGEITYQGRRLHRFNAAVESLLERNLAFTCTCSRQQVRAAATSHGPLGPVYPGTCRNRAHPADPQYRQAVRLRAPGTRVEFYDRGHGRAERDVGRDIGDFIIRRADGLPAYVLAAVVDDHDQGVTDVVRGDDLFEFTPAQVCLQQLLGFATPTYLHFPVATTSAGEKLSKQTGAPPVDAKTPSSNLHRCLEFLGQAPPEELETAAVADIWAWAASNWRPEALARPAPEHSAQETKNISEI